MNEIRHTSPCKIMRRVVEGMNGTYMECKCAEDDGRPIIGITLSEKFVTLHNYRYGENISLDADRLPLSKDNPAYIEACDRLKISIDDAMAIMNIYQGK